MDDLCLLRVARDRVDLGRLLVVAACIAAALLTAPAAAAQDRNFSQSLTKLFAADGHEVPVLITVPAGGMNFDMPAVIHLHGGPGAAPLPPGSGAEGSGLLRRWVAGS